LRGTYGQAQQNVKIKCTYDRVNEADMFDSQKMSIFSAGTLDSIKNDFCNPKNFNDLKNHANCQNYYRGKNTLNAEYLRRILVEKPTTWPDDQAMREIVLSVSLGVDPQTRQQTADAQDASALITAYCLTHNPNGWAQNANMRSFINHLFDSDAAAQTNDFLRSIASTIINTYCGGNPGAGTAECGCYNAQTKLFSGCSGHPEIPGCAEIDSINTALNAAPPAFASIIATLRSPSGIKPICVSEACVVARQNPGGQYLRTADAQTMDCSDNITLCMQSIKAGGSIAPGATINQSCSTVLNIQGNQVPAGGVNLNAQVQQVGNTITANQGQANSPGGLTLSTAPPGSVMVKGTAYKLKDFIIKPGKSKFVDSNIETPEKQKITLGGVVFCICCCCIILIIMMMGGDDEAAVPVGPSASNLAQERLSALLAKI
jgi:hypothetical protein